MQARLVYRNLMERWTIRAQAGNAVFPFSLLAKTVSYLTMTLSAIDLNICVRASTLSRTWRADGLRGAF